MTDRELLEMALDALECWQRNEDCNEPMSNILEALRARLAQPENDFNPDWDAIAVMVEEQQRMAKRIEELEARLAQPEQKLVVKLKELLEVQGRDGTWNYDPYFHGMYNGMEVMLAVLENREPVFRGAPKKWLSKKEWQGLTDEEVKILATQGRTDFSRPVYNEFYSAIEAKLKEKNNG
jgi:hypothetical protein